jgi:FkbM family methyltransferase
VHSFEPVPSTFARLQQHVAANLLDNVKINPMALWNEDSTVTLRLPREDVYNTGNWTVGATESQSTPVSAEAIALDRYAAHCGLPRIDVIKMDIQGAEPFALAGARKLLEDCHPTIMMEIHRPSLRALGSSPEMVWDQLSDLGYRAWRIRPSLKNSGATPNLDGVEFENFFFHCADLPLEVTSGWQRRVPKQWACSGWSS